MQEHPQLDFRRVREFLDQLYPANAGQQTPPSPQTLRENPNRPPADRRVRITRAQLARFAQQSGLPLPQAEQEMKARDVVIID